MHRSVFRACVLASAFLTVGTNGVIAGVWSEELSGERGEAVHFCINNTCEDTRYILIGSTRNWSFMELANGFRQDIYFSEILGLSKVNQMMGDEKISPEAYATLSIGNPDGNKKSLVTVEETGRYITVEGRIDEDMHYKFDEAVSNSPNLIGVSLRSGGGTAEAAIDMAEIIIDRRLSTFIPEDAGCIDACATVFLAGYDRKAEGHLEISRLVSASGDQDAVWSRQQDVLRAAENNYEIVELLMLLDWNESYWGGDVHQFDRDLPGDARDR